MTMTRTLTTLAVLPVLAAAGQGIAVAAPGQPGLAVPGDGQPGLSQEPAPPAAPSLADYIPDPPTPPARPRPNQQNSPNTDTLVQPPQTTEPEPGEEPQPVPEAAPADPNTLRAGNTTVAVPDWIDTKTRDKAQAYLNYAEWQIAAGYDALGFPREESDRRAASTLAGGIVGALTGVELVGIPAVAIGCLGGSVVGGLAGAAIGATAAGVEMPFGAALGIPLGCLAGGAVGMVPGIALGGMAGTLIGGAVAGALGSGVDVTQPDTPPPLLEVSTAHELTPADSNPVGQPIADALAVVGAQVDTAVTSLREALATMPPLIPRVPS
ncbi:hypothetical protein H0264_28855 [Nocardia huaxiensis]|uniref:Uncharacterized protein n=1 Tax=Nocardia huaxiensis TaxID=2755382 RepID=A0A7D6ZGD3_9NOCA|nr:hypothetical protein [Nocardia huaxiensis]QLY29260.1 hypothetical protein H0264_28855 [Nocardia huaxiensis]